LIRLESESSSELFLDLDDFFGSELDTSPGMILAGCDAEGPFSVGCRGLIRFPEVSAGLYNNDAFAVDPNSQAMYFIHVDNMELQRLPVDSTVATGPVETVTGLTADETIGADGMVVADNGDVYILVDTDNTKSIVRVTPGGTKTTAFDFTTRGAGNAAGVQRDLAIWRADQGVLFTIDTLNNVLLSWSISQQGLTEFPVDPAAPEALSLNDGDGNPVGGERIGLSVLP
jgi:sugar lactone lactonase YvrE